MATLRQMQQRVEKLEKKGLDQIYLAVMQNQTEEIIEQNRQQMLEGKTSKGKKIKPKYASKAYQKKTQNKQRLGGTPDLKVSGDFHSDIKLKKKKSDFEFTTSLSYVKKYVIPKYDDIFGLEPVREKKFRRDVFIPEYTKKVKQELQIL